jgi:hypothetical protein
MAKLNPPIPWQMSVCKTSYADFTWAAVKSCKSNELTRPHRGPPRFWTRKKNALAQAHVLAHAHRKTLLVNAP